MTEGEKQQGQSKADSEEEDHRRCSVRFPRHPESAALDFGRPPLDGAEPGVAEVIVGEAPGSNRLANSVAIVRSGRIPDRHDVLDPDRVAFVNANVNDAFPRKMRSEPSAWWTRGR